MRPTINQAQETALLDLVSKYYERFTQIVDSFKSRDSFRLVSEIEDKVVQDEALSKLRTEIVDQISRYELQPHDFQRVQFDHLLGKIKKIKENAAEKLTSREGTTKDDLLYDIQSMIILKDRTINFIEEISNRQTAVTLRANTIRDLEKNGVSSGDARDQVDIADQVVFLANSGDVDHINQYLEKLDQPEAITHADVAVQQLMADIVRDHNVDSPPNERLLELDSTHPLKQSHHKIRERQIALYEHNNLLGNRLDRGLHRMKDDIIAGAGRARDTVVDNQQTVAATVVAAALLAYGVRFLMRGGKKPSVGRQKHR